MRTALKWEAVTNALYLLRDISPKMYYWLYIYTCFVKWLYIHSYFCTWWRANTFTSHGIFVSLLSFCAYPKDSQHFTLCHAGTLTLRVCHAG